MPDKPVLIVDYEIRLDRDGIKQSNAFPPSSIAPYSNNFDVKQEVISTRDFVDKKIEVNNFSGLVLPVYCGRVDSNLEKYGHPERPIKINIPFAYQVIDSHFKDGIELPPTLVWSSSDEELLATTKELVQTKKIQGIEFLVDLDDWDNLKDQSQFIKDYTIWLGKLK